MIFNQTAEDRKVRSFLIAPSFLAPFKNKQPNWGGLGFFTYKRSYARDLADGKTEEWWQTVQRVVEGCFNIQKIHCRQMGLPWNDQKAQHSAQEMFQRIWDFKFTPPGRGLWVMGTDLVYERGSASLQNCFAGETEIITAEGVKSIGSLVGTTQRLLSKNGKWVDAPIRSFGKQKLWKLVVRRQGIEKTIYCTKDHRWFANDNGNNEFKTSELRPEVHHLQSVFESEIKSFECPWLVQSVEETDREEEVFCATVEGEGAFALEGNILTGNCAFTSTENIGEEFASPFVFLMDMSMLGVGVGGDTKGAGKVRLGLPKTTTEPFVVGDTREGWVDLVKTVLNSFVGKGQYPLVIDYSKVRGRGTPIKTFGGTASGPKPLQGLIENLTRLLLPQGVAVKFDVDAEPDLSKLYTTRISFDGRGDAYKITSSQIVDVFNFIGKAVVAGGLRRCLPKGTLVHTSVGLIPIEKVSKGMSVMASQGYSPVTDWVAQGVQPISQITTQMGVFECTAKHKIAVTSDIFGGYTWKQAWELTSGDRMVFVDRPIDGIETSLPTFEYVRPKHSTTCKDILIPELTSEIAWFFGLFHGDGYNRLTVNSGNLSIAIAEGQEPILERAKKAFSLFGINSGVLMPQENDRCYKLNVKSKQLATYMDQFKRANESIVVPDFINQGTLDIRSGYVAGLSDADGSYRSRPLCIAASVYPQFLVQVQAVCASLGIPTRFKLHKDKTRTEKGWQPLYYLNLIGEKAIQSYTDRIAPAISKFEDNRATKRSQNDYGFPSEMVLAGGVNGYKRGHTIWCRNTRQATVAMLERLTDRKIVLVPVEVLSVEHSVREAETYDISVEAGEFVAQGGYLVHNTAEILFGDPEDKEFMTLKQDPEALSDRRWASNNSLFGYVGMDYTESVKSMQINGEPGLLWLENARRFGRMNGIEDKRDWRASGCNPCFAGETLIAVADGRGAVPIKQLVTEGCDIPVYALDPKTGKVEIKMGRNPRLTREASELVRVVLDDGTSLRVTPDHKMILLDGTQIEAKDLRPGDSLPRFTKNPEVVVKNGPKYLRVYTDTREPSKSKIFEHRLIAKFYHPEIWNQVYDEARFSGWVRGGLVVHHKDYDFTNNADANLEIMNFRDHNACHGRETQGEKNGMWGKHHRPESLLLIGQKTKERCSDPAFCAKLSAAHTQAERDAASIRMSDQRKSEMLTYYKEQEIKTDLDTVWVGDRLYAVRKCEFCGEEFIVSWADRGQSYCSRSCANTKESSIEARKVGRNITFMEKQRNTLHQQVQTFKALQENLGRDPQKKEWEQRCRDLKISFRFRVEGTTNNPHALTSYRHLKEVAQNYNHRVKEVQKLSETEPVYNLSVDAHHTVGIVTEYDPKTKGCWGIFTHQCGEQTLESMEMCTLVETYPAHHDSYEDFEKTLKTAYLYAKTVTLVPTHDPRANAVMMRNRRIGCSMSGIIQAMVKLGRRQFLTWCDRGYEYVQKLDRIYSDWLGIPLSIKVTSVKPSGCLTPDTSIRSTVGEMSLLDLFALNGVDLGARYLEYREWHPTTKDFFVYDSNGDTRKITQLFINGVEETVRFTFPDDSIVECTPNHKFQMANGVWKMAQDITEDDDFLIK